MTVTSRFGNRRSSFGNFTLGHGGDVNADTYFETISFSQTGTFSGIYQRIRSELISQTFTISQQAIRVIIELVTHTFTVTQLASSPKISNRAINQIFEVTHLLQPRFILSRSLVNNLIFQSSFTRYLNMINTYVTVPTLQVIKVKGGVTFVLLESGSNVIVLPGPILGDIESSTGLKLTLKHSIIGSTRTYVKKVDCKGVKYTFQLNRKKSLELRAFLISNLGSVIKMTNWKGEVWYVHIVNAPVELIAKSRWSDCYGNDRIDVTLDLEGIQITG